MLEGLILGALNHLLEQAAWARRQLSGFAGRRARFEMPPWKLAFRVDEQGRLAPADDQAVDVTVVLPAGTPLVALQGMDRAMAAAHVTGNAEFATALSFVLKNLRWDVEEDLSKLVGDITAHRLVQGANRFVAWQQQAAIRLAENMAEYLTLENPLLVPRVELLALRDEIARLEAALGNAENRLTALAR